jgi:hypothetical protein
VKRRQRSWMGERIHRLLDTVRGRRHLERAAQGT